MKSGKVLYTNQKGQIVIPKNYRDALEINPSVPLNIQLRESTIWIIPIEDFVTRANKETTYSETLKKTQGKWGCVKEEQAEYNARKRKLEINASRKRKKKW